MECDYLIAIPAIDKNPEILRQSFGDDNNPEYMFIEDIALITLSTPYKETTRYIRPACIPIGPKFKDFGWVKLKIFQNQIPD